MIEKVGNLKKYLSILEKHLLLILIMISFVIVSSVLTLSFSVFIIQMLLLIITAPLIMKKSYSTAKVYITIYIVSIFFVFLIYYANQIAYGNSYYIGGSDDLKFEQQGSDALRSNVFNLKEMLGKGILEEHHNSPFFVIYISLLIRFANLFDGYNTFIPRIMNVYFLIFIAMLFEYFIKKYANFSDHKANAVILIFALNPNIQYINSHVFRDTFNLLQMFLILFTFDILINESKYLKKMLALIILMFMVYITFYTRRNSLVFAGLLCLFMLGEKFKLKKRYIIALPLLLLTINKFRELIDLEYFITSYTKYILENTAIGLSKYIFKQPLLPFGIILRFFYGLITPFPNFFGLFKKTDMFALDFINFLIYCGTIVQTLFIPFILKRILRLDWLGLSFLVCFLGVVLTTFTFRHFIFYYPFMVALGVEGYMSSSKKNRKQILSLSATMVVLLGLIYIYLKFFS